MKKTYIIPEVEIHAICVETLIAESPAVTIADDSETVDAGGVDVKRGNYDVWDEDWSK